MERKNEFSVYWWDPLGNWTREKHFVDIETALKTAKSFTERPAALIGVIRRVIITDGGDCMVFEWKFGEGVTFPPRKEGKKNENHTGA